MKRKAAARPSRRKSARTSAKKSSAKKKSTARARAGGNVSRRVRAAKAPAVAASRLGPTVADIIRRRTGKRGRRKAAPGPMIGMPMIPVTDSDLDTRAIPIARVAPILPIRRTVLFPFALLPFNVGRKRSIELLNQVMTGDRIVAVFTQRDATVEEPTSDDLYPIGTLANVARMVRVSDDQISILVQGIARVGLGATESTEPYLTAHVDPLGEQDSGDVETEALVQSCLLYTSPSPRDS